MGFYCCFWVFSFSFLLSTRKVVNRDFWLLATFCIGCCVLVWVCVLSYVAVAMLWFFINCLRNPVACYISFIFCFLKMYFVSFFLFLVNYCRFHRRFPLEAFNLKKKHDWFRLWHEEQIKRSFLVDGILGLINHRFTWTTLNLFFHEKKNWSKNAEEKLCLQQVEMLCLYATNLNCYEFYINY